jgi:pimeloyl-ACP methyl ester carboxylesterase
MDTIEEFRIDIPQAELDDLRPWVTGSPAPVRRLAEQSNNIVHWSEFDRGGHFAAMEEPDLLVGDVREFFRPLR